MGTLSNFATSELVDHVFKAAYTPISTLYICLCTSAPTAASTGSTIVETDYASYARDDFTVTSFNAAATRKIVQALDFEFPAATGNSTNPVTHYAICDASSNGNMLAFGSFNSSFSIVSGNTPKIAAAEIEISFGASTNGFTDICVHKMLDLMFRDITWTSPNATIHFGLATAVVSDSTTMGTITECAVANNYAREAVPALSIDPASSGVTTNNTEVTFNTPSGSWGTVTSMFVVNDASGTAGDLLAFDNTNIVDQEPTTDDTVTFAIGAFDVDLD